MIISNATSFYLKRYFTHYFVNKLLVDDTKNVKSLRDRTWILDYIFILKVVFVSSASFQNCSLREFHVRAFLDLFCAIE